MEEDEKLTSDMDAPQHLQRPLLFEVGEQMSIKPAILADLERAWPGGRRGLYEPYLATTVDFIRQCDVLGVPIVIVGGVNFSLLNKHCSGPEFAHVRWGLSVRMATQAGRGNAFPDC